MRNIFDIRYPESGLWLVHMEIDCGGYKQLNMVRNVHIARHCRIELLQNHTDCNEHMKESIMTNAYQHKRISLGGWGGQELCKQFEGLQERWR